MTPEDPQPRAKTPTDRPTASARDRLVFSERDLDAHGILTRKTRYLHRLAGRFPQPRPIGARKLYLGDEIREWLADPAAWAERHGARGAA